MYSRTTTTAAAATVTIVSIVVISNPGLEVETEAEGVAMTVVSMRYADRSSRRRTNISTVLSGLS
jgi:hypothetical protein